MITDPQAFFRFVADHSPLITDFYFRSEGLSDLDVMDLITRHEEPGAPNASHVMGRLASLRIIEQIPGETAQWEMTHPVRALLRFLLHEQRLTSVAVIQAYLDDLESTRKTLENSITSGDRATAVLGLREMAESVERLRQDSSDNRSAIIEIVMKTKTNQDHIRASERFGIINRIWERYMDPMRDLVDVRKSMEALLDGLDRLLYAGTLKFHGSPDTAASFSGSRARLLRLRREVAADFHESLREIEPLYKSLKRESELARGASIALAQISKKGVASLELDKRMGLQTWRVEGLLSDADLAARFHELCGYTPGEAPLVTGIEASSPDDFVDPRGMLRSLRASLPVTDLLVWLEENYPEHTLTDILRLYGAAFTAPSIELGFGSVRVDYRIDGTRVSAVPVSVLEVDPE